MRAEWKRPFIRAMIVTGGIGLAFFLLIFGAAFLLGNWEQFGGPKVALLEVDGIISEPEGIIEQIRHHMENRTVQAFIIHIPNVSDLLQKVGIRSVVIKSGPYKDMASTTRDLSREEQQLLQRLID